MSVELKVLPSAVRLRDLPDGEAFRRLSDNQYFFKTHEHAVRDEADGSVPTCVCVAVPEFHVHRVRADAKVQPVPRTIIRMLTTG
jgi:hypothetical protein